MHAAVDGGDAVGEAVEAVGVEAGVPLEGHLHLVGVAVDVLGGGEVADRVEEPDLRLVEPAHVVDDAAGVAEGLPVGVRVRSGPQVPHPDLQPPVQEGHHLQPLDHRLVPERHVLQHGPVGPEADAGAGAGRAVGRRRRPVHGQGLVELAAVGEAHAVQPPGAADLDLQAPRQRVDHRHADPVEPARDLVAVAPELAAGVQQGHHQLGRRDLVVERMGIDGDAAAVVGDLAGAVGVEGDVDAGAVPGHGLVDGVVDHLPHQMVQAGRAGRADVHAGPLADGFKALQDGDLQRAVGAVVAGGGGGQGRLVGDGGVGAHATSVSHSGRGRGTSNWRSAEGVVGRREGLTGPTRPQQTTAGRAGGADLGLSPSWHHRSRV